MTDARSESEDPQVNAAINNVRSARALLSDFEDVSVEVKDGALKHAIEELEIAQRRLPDDY